MQGVGFRPFVYRLATSLGLDGWVVNSTAGVDAEVEGPPAAVEAFLAGLTEQAPHPARILSVSSRWAPPLGYRGFAIRDSRQGAEHQALIPPDLAICDECRREVLSPGDRRYRYPFTNCTRCGPRYTIIRALPYDRPQTSMRDFPMCPECEHEYHDPGSRRFHAQPNACAACGPHLWLADGQGNAVPGDPLAEAARLLAAGAILALKGLGGFHLACDAKNPQAVARLRERKHRPARPLAVMVRDIETARRYCRVSDVEARLLESPAAPIVVLERRPEAWLPEELAPGQRTLGVMLPYTPLHVLLMAQRPELDVLVMSSGNASGLPLAKDNEEALASLRGIADGWLLHNRGIEQRCDDSVVRVAGSKTIYLRRSRGFVPAPLLVPGLPEGPAVLAVGGEIKNVFCYLDGSGGDGRLGGPEDPGDAQPVCRAILGPHIGDLGTVEVEESFHAAWQHLSRLLEAEPQLWACDLHPGYAGRRLAHALARAAGYGPERVVEIQHHHAHLASCLAENACIGPAIGLIWDGSGYGEDGAIWGGETLWGDCAAFQRLGHFRYVPLPGGERAILQPARILASVMWDADQTRVEEVLAWRYGPAGGREEGLGHLPAAADDALEAGVALAMLKRRFPSPQTSSCGRLFDGAAALLGFSGPVTYEGQAAVEFSELAREARDGAPPEPLPFALSQEGVLDFRPAWLELARLAARLAPEGGEILTEAWLSGAGRGSGRAGALRRQLAALALRWQETLVAAGVAAVEHAAGAHTTPGSGQCAGHANPVRAGRLPVVLSGGVFQNAYLLVRLSQELESRGWRVLVHRHVPANDGGIALGQAVVARFRWRARLQTAGHAGHREPAERNRPGRAGEREAARSVM